MTAPWCVKLQQYILLVVNDKILVVLGHNDENRTFVALWDRIRLDATKSSTNLAMESSVISLSAEKGNLVFLTVSWIANEGNLSLGRFRLAAWAPKALASMVAMFTTPLCFWATDLSFAARSARSSGVSAKMYARGMPAWEKG